MDCRWTTGCQALVLNSASQFITDEDRHTKTKHIVLRCIRPYTRYGVLRDRERVRERERKRKRERDRERERERVREGEIEREREREI